MTFTNGIPPSDKEGKKLFVSPSFLEKILKASHSSPDKEICGLLIGKRESVIEIMPMQNKAAYPERFFEISAADLIKSHRRVRQRQLSIIGHYHSHPSGSCRPSPRDAALAHEGQYWIIAASNKIEGWYAGKNGTVEGIFHPCRLVVE
ncbi:proteasome lid subunit RPN8/RPN11 [Zymomonas mobilis]|uniref:Proteasome lid subunit RPN8/RPN11 n=1 Tax=Zymomonas mobilis TaxID=542 RepID=A0A542W0T8_ZYMMB|nr:M67 family metallopeptidase [Zymomonas mobilis]TQL17190.1 proteasome lid subunit RPN8/RPN11 [Zymomonas mobilis]